MRGMGVPQPVVRHEADVHTTPHSSLQDCDQMHIDALQEHDDNAPLETHRCVLGVQLPFLVDVTPSVGSSQPHHSPPRPVFF